MAKFGQGLIQGLTNPQFQQGLFELGDRIAERRRDERELQAIQGAAALGNKGVQFAQAGNVSGLNDTIKQMQNQLSQKGITVARAKVIQSQIQQLQGLVPETKNISRDNSVNSALSIDARLKNEDALRKAMPNLSEAEFQQAVQSLKDNRSELLLNPRVAEKYNTRSAAVRRADREISDLAHEDYVSKNSNALEAAIKNNDTAGVQNFITNAGPRYADDAQKYVSLITGNIETMQRLEENSIANTQTPNVSMYQTRVDALPEGQIKTMIESTLQEYKKAVKSGWNEEKQEWGTRERKNAERIEKSLNAMINGIGMNDLSNQLSSQRASNRELDSQIDAQEAIINLQVPTESMQNEARLRAATINRGRTKRDARNKKVEAPPTEQEINDAARVLLRDAQTNARSQLEQLMQERYPDAEQPEQTSELESMEDNGGYSTKINGNVTTISMIKEALKTQSEQQVKDKLRRSGASEEQLETLFSGL